MIARPVPFLRRNGAFVCALRWVPVQGISDARAALELAAHYNAIHPNTRPGDSHAPGVAVPSIPVDGAAVSSRGVA